MGDTRAILITGAAGFLGSALGQRLMDAGERVVGLDVAPADNLPFPCITRDVRDADAISTNYAPPFASIGSCMRAAYRADRSNERARPRRSTSISWVQR